MCQSQCCEAKTITQRPSCEKEQIQDAVDCEDVEHVTSSIILQIFLIIFFKMVFYIKNK